LQGLGLTPGSYVFDYGDDSISFNVIGATSPPAGVVGVPVDSQVALALLAILMILGGAAVLHRR
jgi:hypothetical protein